MCFRRIYILYCNQTFYELIGKRHIAEHESSSAFYLVIKPHCSVSCTYTYTYTYTHIHIRIHMHMNWPITAVWGILSRRLIQHKYLYCVILTFKRAALAIRNLESLMVSVFFRERIRHLILYPCYLFGTLGVHRWRMLCTYTSDVIPDIICFEIGLWWYE